MRIFRNIVLAYHRVRDYLKGGTLTRIAKESTVIGHMSILTELSYRIDVYCEKTTFERVSLGFIKSKQNRSVYKLFSNTTELVPDALKRACELVIYFPPLIHTHYSDEKQANVLMNAYIDLLQSTLVMSKLKR